MKILTIPVNVEIDEDDIAKEVKKVVVSAVLDSVRSRVSMITAKMGHEINEAIEVYLNKRLTAEDLKAEIDKAVARLVEEKLRERF